tara:strand:- start:889 stop:2454 length:1566 start_codon:yes stop_codon:yes gene_type:complete
MASDFRRIAEQNIFPGESGGDYNALFGYSNRAGGRYGGQKLTDMTVNQALDFAKPSGDYGQWVKGQVGRVATPMGAYQVVGTTLRAAQKGLGLTGGERMTEGLQDRIGEWIYQTQGPGAWEGWRGKASAGNQAIANDAMRAIGKQPIGSTVSAPTGGILSNEGNQMAQQQQPQGLLSSMGIQRRDPNAQGETSQPFYDRKSFGDTMARIAPALGRMGVMGLEGPAQAALDSRNKRQGDERALAKASQQRNATAEWLRSQGSNELADGVLSGAITGAQALSNMQASAGGSDTVQSSVPLDDGTTVIIMRNGSRRVLAPDGTELSGQAAADAILAAREYTVANQTAIYQGRRTGSNTGDANTGGAAAAARSEGAALGTARAADTIQLQTMQRNMPGLEDTVSRLDELSGKASYGKAAVLADDARRALGKEVSLGGIARAEYIAIVDNEILPLLKQTFGAAFTEEEGARLRATLGNEDATPAERRASLDAFIKQKKAQIQSYSGPQTPTAGTLSSEADAFMRGN